MPSCVCSFGDASLNHSTAAGALNAAAYLAHRHKDCPVLLVCEDNGIGISTPSPRGWVGAALQSVPGVPYFEVDGDAPIALLGVVRHAFAEVRESRRPAILHLHTVRFMGHAGSDVEIAYRTPRAIAADLERDPLVATARVLVERGVRTPTALEAEYDALRAEVANVTAEVRTEEPLVSREQVLAPLTHAGRRPVVHRVATAPDGVTLAQAINQTLAAELAADPGVLVFGEDVAAKGGVYGVTRGLAATFGSGRVFDTLLDEQTVLGTALGAALAGYTPVPEIQYLAYLHNAEDQLRGEAASLRFFSAGQHDNGMVVRIAGLAYQKGFGGHFHNDNSVAVLRDIPGLVLAVPSHPALAPALLRGCLALAREEGRVVVLLEPIARYHTRDLVDGDGEWLAASGAAGALGLGDVAVHGSGADLLLVTFGNGVHLSRTAALTLEAEGIATTVLDLVWLAPLPVEALVDAACAARAVLVVDETRASGGVSEGVVAALVDAGVDVPLARVTSADSGTCRSVRPQRRCCCRSTRSSRPVGASAAGPGRARTPDGGPSAEDDGVAAVQQHTVLAVPAGPHATAPALSASRPAGGQVCGRVERVVDANHVLLDDRALVEVGRHVVGGGADQLHAAGVCLVVGLGALEARQEGVVDVDRAAGSSSAAQLVAQSTCM